MTFDWNRARAFLVTAEEGSLSAASRALGMTQPTLGRQVAALEEELGVVLFERAGRGLTLTPSGLDLVDHVRGMGEAATRFSLAASGQSQSLEGSVCISASEVDATFRLPGIIARIRREEPGIEIEVVVSQEASDLRRREADIAIRSFQPTQPNLIARKIRDIPIHLYATPDYMERVGNPAPDADLTAVDFIGFDRTDMVVAALNQAGMNVTQDNFPIICKFQLLQWGLARQGLGIVIFPEDIGDGEPLVRRAFPGQEPVIIIPQWLVCHRELNTSRRVRRVFDLLAEELGKA
ncbi:LysR family transcriptional regulator [Hyphomonas sp.]|uniref:LysR family transcriptional regulator n=1 Tax=Hyphomonas sp. TaxID=87 RepID=UPI0030F9412E